MTTAPLLSFDLDRVHPVPPERVPVERLVLDVLTSGEGMSESSRCTVLLRPVDGGTRLELTVEGLSGPEAAAGMRTGWQWCLEGIAEQLGAAA